MLSDRKAPAIGNLQVAGEYEQLLATASPDYDFPDFDENAQATTFYTSGTTGLPKGVYYSHRQIILHVMAELAFLGIAGKQGRFHRDDVYMPMTPMYHVHAWGFPWAATVAGTKQVYPGRYDPAMLLKLIKTEGVTFTHCVPTLVQMLLGAAADANVNLDGLKMLIGGSALPKALAKQALARGIDIFSGYGMSETGPLLTLAQLDSSHLTGDPDQEVEIRTEAGRSCPLVDLRIVGADMKEMPQEGNASGEIVVRAPWLTQGYFNDPEASEQLWIRGYLHTEDIGVMTSDGYLQITDRIKDVIKSGGEWISSLEVEDIITHLAGVAECAVIGVKDARWGERPLALIVRNPKVEPPLTEDAVRAHVMTYSKKGVISKYAVPQQILFVDTIAKTSIGKINKKVLRAQYGDLP